MVIIHGKGDKDATIPLAPRTRAAVEQAVDGRDDGPLLRNRWGNRMTRNNVAASTATPPTPSPSTSPDPSRTHGRCARVARGSPGVGVVGVAAVPDGDDPHGLVIGQFVDDAVDPDAVGPQASEATTQLMSEVQVTLELAERIQNGIGKPEVERCQRLTGATGELDAGH